MPVAPLSFPKWEEVLSGLIEKYRLQINLPESLVNDAHELVKKTSTTHSRYSSGAPAFDHGTSSIRLPKSLINEIQNENNLEPNQFLSISTIEQPLVWLDPRAYQILDIPFGSFTSDNLTRWYQNPIVYHPMDVFHLSRYNDLIRRFSTVDGMLKDIENFYFITQFRITISKGVDDNRVRSFRHIRKNSRSIEIDLNTLPEKRALLEIWTVSSDAERHKDVMANIELIDQVERTTFLNSLLFLFNARSLGFNTKDVLVINYNNLYDGPEEGRASLNRALRKHHDEHYEFEVKPYTDCWYYLNKKLTTSLEKHSIEEIYKSSFYVRLNRFSKARRLGLIPLPREIREVILSKVDLSH